MKKRTIQQSPVSGHGPLTPAERIDAAILAAAEAYARRDSAELEASGRKQVVVRLALDYGIPDGKSRRLRGRQQACTATQGRQITIDADAARALPARWRRLFCRPVPRFAATRELERALASPCVRNRLPQSVRRFLRQNIVLTQDWMLRFDGAPRPQPRGK